MVQWCHLSLAWWEDPQRGGDTLTAGGLMGQEGMRLRETTGQLAERYLQRPEASF